MGADLRQIVGTAIVASLMTGGSSVASSTTLFGMVDTGELFASTNSGATWTPRSTLPVTDAVALAAGLTSSALHLVTESGSVYSSADAGGTWTPVGALAVSDAVDLALAPGGALVVLARTGGVYRSTDGGTSFDAIGAMPASGFVGLAYLAGQTYFAATETGEVMRSTDGGATWLPAGTVPVPDAVQVRSLASRLFLLTGTGDVYRSTDEGSSWVAIGTLSQVGMTGMTRAGSALVVATREGHTATSADGVTWSWQGSINQVSVRALGVDTPATGVDVALPSGGAFDLSAPRPNPCRSGASTFRFRTDATETLAFELFDVRGRIVAERAPETFEGAGTRAVRWDPGALGGGVYFVRVTSASGKSDGTRWAILR